MRTTLVLTVRGHDRPGLIEQLSTVVAAHAGSFAETRMIALGGRVAGLHLVSVPSAQAAALASALRALASTLPEFHVDVDSGVAPVAVGQRLRLELVGLDRPGIVREVTRLLARHGVSIDEFETRCVSGSFAGGELFEVHAHLVLPARLESERLRELLAALAQEMMVDITLEDGKP